MDEKNKKEISRRDFLKITGIGTAVTAAALYGCRPSNRVSAEGGILGEVPTDKMTYRVNPHTGDRVSILGYGCMRWPLRTNSEGKEEINQDAVNELVDYALAHGVNYFDTAPRYIRGWSEPATGIALSRHPRDSYFVATKMTNTGPNDKSLESSKAMYERSKRNLQVDYIDYYLLHAIGLGGMEDYRKRFEENGLLDFLLEERAAGRIRNLGFSYHGDIAVFDHLLSLDIQWDFAQIQLNYIDWQHATGANTNAEYLLGELEKRNVPAIIMEPLLGGRLARVPSQAMTLMREVNADDTPAKWAFRYAGNPESVLTVLSGMTYMEHLQENIRTYAPMKPLDEQELETLERVTEIMLNADYVQCTACQYCMPCPYGIDIPGVFSHYNRCISAGRVLKSSKDENYRKARKEFLVGYDRSVPNLRQANHCIGCRLCVPKCTQSLDIPKEMRRIDRYAELLKQRTEF